MATEGSEKKRKRTSEKHDRPRKKPAIDTTSSQAQKTNGVANKSPKGTAKQQTNGISNEQVPEKAIKFIHVPAQDGIRPVVATLPGMSLPSNITLEAYEKPGSTPELLLHSSSHPRMDYTARQNQDGGLDNQLKHYIGVYDPDKQEMQLIEATKMSVRSTVRAEVAEVRREQQERDEVKPLNARQQLGLEFGTKKAQKAIRSITENAVSSSQLDASASQQDIQDAIKANPTAAAVLDSMSASADAAPTKEQMQAAVDDAKPRPKHNLEAKDVEDAYPIESKDVMGDELLQLIKVKDWFDTVANGKDVLTSSRFVSHRLRDILPDLDRDSDQIHKAKIGKYVLALIQFYKALRPGKKGAPRKLPKPDELKEKVPAADPAYILNIAKKKFAGGSELSKWHIDNLMTHIAVLTLHIDDFETDTYDLREDLGLSQKEMDTYFKEIGAKMLPLTEKQRTAQKITKEVANLHKVASLSLPLQFPKQRVVPLKGRR